MSVESGRESSPVAAKCHNVATAYIGRPSPLLQRTPEIADPEAGTLAGMETVHIYALVCNTACGHPFGTNALRISRSFAFTLTAFSWPIRTRIFWPAESSSSFGSANSYSTLG